MDILIFMFIVLNILLPTYILAMGWFEKKWHIYFSYIVPLGCILIMLIEGIPSFIKSIISEFKKLK